MTLAWGLFIQPNTGGRFTGVAAVQSQPTLQIHDHLLQRDQRILQNLDFRHQRQNQLALLSLNEWRIRHRLLWPVDLGLSS